MGLLSIFLWLVDIIAPIFLILSPITSYTDQMYSIYRTKTSSGFSLDIPLIMLMASILKVYYWLGVHYELALLVQAFIMLVMQSVLLHVALKYRPSSSVSLTPSTQPPNPFNTHSLDAEWQRPYKFWQWSTPRPYWLVLAYTVVALSALQLLLGWNATYAHLVGAVALAIEAMLPVPQIIANQRRRGCKGFRLSVLVNWLFGDMMKIIFFLVKDASAVPWAFKLCGIFQAACDVYLGIQFYQFGDGEPGSEGRKLKDDVAWLKRKGIELMGLEKQ